MSEREVEGKLRYKDRGKIAYKIIEGSENESDILELIYADNEKSYSWAYVFPENGKTALEHIKESSYEELKRGFIDNLNHNHYYLHKGEYQLLKEAIVIFVSHKYHIQDICSEEGMC